MIDPPSPAELGEPDLKILGFRLWVHTREYPDAITAWDWNRLRVTAHCSGAGASVWAHGTLIMVPDIMDFGEACDAMHRFESPLAVLDPYEPNLKIRLELIDHLGHIRTTVKITPDHLTQQHTFQFNADQSYLPEISRQCRRITKEYPASGQDT